MRIKRPRYLFVLMQDSEVVDIRALLRGRLRMEPQDQTLAITLLTQRERRVSAHELGVLHRTPSSRWIEVGEVMRDTGASERLVMELAEQGFLLCDGDQPGFAALRERDRMLSENGWQAGSAFFHFMARNPDAPAVRSFETLAELERRAATSPRRFEELIEKKGDPPPHFHERPMVGEAVPLAVPGCHDDLSRLLLKRKTSRRFEPDREIQREQLETLLYLVFGCHGTARLSESGKLVGLKKSSPSGGSLHPTEVYPLVLRVEGVPSGLYHYSVRDHALNPVAPMSAAEAADFAQLSARGQAFARGANAVFILTTRFYRNFWKYGAIPWAYGVLLMDAGHLSQTFYLVCERLGLGAFFTAAVDGPAIENTLGLDGFAEAAIGLCGCGVAAADTMLSLRPKPHMPERPI